MGVRVTKKNVVGGGQAGVQVAARFRQMNIRALVVEASDRCRGSSPGNRPRWEYRAPS